MRKVPRNERETVITFDVELDQWEVYTNHPPHIRRYRDKVIPKREEFYKDGSEAVLEGVIHGSVGVRGKRNISDAERERLAEQMRVNHKKGSINNGDNNK